MNTMNTFFPYVVTEVVATTPRIIFFLAIGAGISGAIWPFFQNKSGLTAFNSPAAFSLMQAVMLLFFISAVGFLKSESENAIDTFFTILLIIAITAYCRHRWGGRSSGIYWNYVYIASFFSGICLICLTKMMLLAPTQAKAVCLAVMTATSIAVMMAIDLYLNREQKLGWGKILGYPLLPIVLGMILRKGH